MVDLPLPLSPKWPASLPVDGKGDLLHHHGAAGAVSLGQALHLNQHTSSTSPSASPPSSAAAPSGSAPSAMGTGRKSGRRSGRQRPAGAAQSPYWRAGRSPAKPPAWPWSRGAGARDKKGGAVAALDLLGGVHNHHPGGDGVCKTEIVGDAEQGTLPQPLEGILHQAMRRRSSPLVGSSARTRSARRRPHAISTRWRIPPES